MNDLSPQHAIWATVIMTLAKTCLPWVGRQIEKLVDAWVKVIESKAEPKQTVNASGQGVKAGS